MFARQNFLAAVLVAAHVGESARAAVDSWTIQLEIEPTQTTSNTLQKPNDSRGSRFDVVDYAGTASTLGRFSLARAVDWGRADSELRLDVVPFQQSGTQTRKSSIRFDGVTFQANVPLTVLYQFNTYRLTFDLPVFREPNAPWTLRMGGTLALRDAQTRLVQPGARANYINYGPVPLFYALSSWRMGHEWYVEADLDAFPAPGGGGLFDASGRAVWSMTVNTSFFVGVRYEAGGATENTVYTSFHQRSALAGIRFVF